MSLIINDYGINDSDETSDLRNTTNRGGDNDNEGGICGGNNNNDSISLTMW